MLASPVVIVSLQLPWPLELSASSTHLKGNTMREFIGVILIVLSIRIVAYVETPMLMVLRY